MGLKQIGPTTIHTKYRLICHCEAVQIELDLPDGVVDPRRCDCSFCRRRGAIVGSVAETGFRILKGADHSKRYQFGTKVAEHFFYDTCGTYTHHRRHLNPHLFGYNLGCLEGMNSFDLGEVPVFDGVNHPSDRPQNNK
ncbi:MAG: GFA family protein [Alphaproteobacteria bacterium]|nr:GFA family protein [Alphaproteobacteria bacterium]